MRRQIGTALSVIGLLAVAGSAAAINVKVLRSEGSSTGAVLLHKTGAMTVMNAMQSPTPSASATALAAATPKSSAAAASPSPSVPAPTASAPAPQRTRKVTARAAVVPTAQATSEPLAPLGVPLLSGSKEQHQEGSHAQGGMMLPQLSQEQMDLLRVAAMAHVPPELVLAVAKGDTTIDPLLVAAVQKIANYAHVDLASLANVTDIPKLRDRGHGAPNTFGGTNADS